MDWTLTDYLSEQDIFGQWIDEKCERGERATQLSSELHRSYIAWCERNGTRADSIVKFSEKLVSAGFVKKATMVGKVFQGLKLKAA